MYSRDNKPVGSGNEQYVQKYSIFPIVLHPCTLLLVGLALFAQTLTEFFHLHQNVTNGQAVRGLPSVKAVIVEVPKVMMPPPFVAVEELSHRGPLSCHRQLSRIHYSHGL